MPFNSYEFIFVFLPLSVAGFWLLTRTLGRNSAVLWLVAVSVVFYLNAGWLGLAVLAPSILFDYLVAASLLRIPASEALVRKSLFAVGIGANILFLGYFKYKNFFLDTVNGAFDTHFPLVPIVLPLGISFLTFQKIAFLADVQSGIIEKFRFLDYLLFTTFFPRSLAGPIIRYQEFVSQFECIPKREFTRNLSVGVALFSIGLFKKAFVADQIAQFVNPVFDWMPRTVWDPRPPTFLTSWAAILIYTLQLYFDFSGYSDMSLGAARMFGIRLPMNFNSPLKARSIVDFWSRWHITLTRFLTAYIYNPLVLSITRARLAKRKAALKASGSSASTIVAVVVIPTLTTMTISGIWHGAGWQFVVWGLMHGVYLTVNQISRLLRPRFNGNSANYTLARKLAGHVCTFLAVVVALVFFRAGSVSTALSILRAMTGWNGLLPNDAVVLQHLGVTLPSGITKYLLPVTPWIWIGVLLVWVAWLPNSLEILRAYQPALDYPADARETAEGTRDQSIADQRAARRPILRWIENGIPLNRWTAAAAALLFVLGTLMLNHGQTFIYWNF